MLVERSLNFEITTAVTLLGHLYKPEVSWFNTSI